jgi:hypothetical protein
MGAQWLRPDQCGAPRFSDRETDHSRTSQQRFTIPRILGKALGSRDVDLAILETTLRSSSAGLSAVVQHAHIPANENLLLVADQFEEFFRYRSSPEAEYSEAAPALVKLLLSAAADPAVRIYVALTMRSDFIGNCAALPGLPKAVSDGQYLVPRLSRSELRRAITGPAAVVSCEIAPRLVVRLLNEAGDDPDQLPVLQHALMRSWDYWRQRRTADEPIDFTDYEAIGTMRTALSKHAEEAYSELRSANQQRIAEKAFRTLVETDSTGRVVRRPSTIEQICAIADEPEPAVREVIDHFRGASRGFIVLRPDSFLDLTHESLIRIWDRLAGWAKNEAKAAEFYGRLSKAAELQAEGAESLWVNPQLALGLQWLADTRPTPSWAERYGPNLQRALAYLKESRQADRNRRIGKMAAVATMVLLVIAIFAVYAAVKASDNAKLRAANKQLRKSNTSLAGQINSLHQQEAEVAGEVAALRTEQAQLTEDITNRTHEITELASQLKVLHTQGDALVLQIHDATEDRNYTLQLLDRFASSNGSTAQDLITFMKHLRQTIGALGDENQHVDQLYKKVIALGVKLPQRPPIALKAPAVASPGFHVPTKAEYDSDFPPDAYLQELLTKNAALLEQAQQLSEATRNLQQEAVLLRQQNKKLNALSTSLREQAGLLLGETKTLSSLNDLRQQQLTDVKSVGNKLGNLRTILSSEKDKLHQVLDEAEGAADAVDQQRQLTKQIQTWLSRAIDAAQKKE